MIILPSTYLPSIDHLRAVVREDYVIDLGENYVKRSPRNRAEIMTANGIMQLSVNIRRANRPRTPIQQIEIDYSKRWQHQHWMAIVSAYKSSPYFDYYADHLEPLFTTEYKYLAELNIATTKRLLQLMGLPQELKMSHSYIEATASDIDLRTKRSLIQEPPMREYIQVFSDRHPFAQNLSALDLLLCEGPNAVSFLV
ncbi:MAG: WbqC family protein [Rikenellaceae bacterium]